MYRIVETQDYYPVSVMCHECGLEVEPSETAPGYVQKMWKCEDTDTGELVAAAVTAFRDGCHVLENLVVSAARASLSGSGQTLGMRQSSGLLYETGLETL